MGVPGLRRRARLTLSFGRSAWLCVLSSNRVKVFVSSVALCKGYGKTNSFLVTAAFFSGWHSFLNLVTISPLSLGPSASPFLSDLRLHTIPLLVSDTPTLRSAQSLHFQRVNLFQAKQATLLHSSRRLRDRSSATTPKPTLSIAWRRSGFFHFALLICIFSQTLFRLLAQHRSASFIRVVNLCILLSLLLLYIRHHVPASSSRPGHRRRPASCHHPNPQQCRPQLRLCEEGPRTTRSGRHSSR